MILVALWNVFACVWNWAQDDENEEARFGVQEGTNTPVIAQQGRLVSMVRAAREATRRFLRVVLSCLFDFNLQGGDEAPSDDNQFNVGIFLGFFFASRDKLLPSWYCY